MWHHSGGNDEVDEAASKDKQIEDSQTDSGFISSGNLRPYSLSSELSIDSDSEELSRDNIKIAPKSDKGNESSLNIGLDKDIDKLSLKDTTIDCQFDSGIIDANLEDLISGDLEDGEIHLKYEVPKNINISQWELYYSQDNDGDTQLHLAIIQEFIEAAYYLIDLAPHPCLLDIQNDDWDSALHLAVLTNQAKIVRKLVLAGAKVTVRNFQGDMPLHIACDMGHLECIEAMTSPLSEAELFLLGNKKLTFLPQNLNLRNYTGQMCLHLATKKGHIDIIRYLVSIGADVNACEALSGYTPLHLAIERNMNDVAIFLVRECRAKIDSKQYSGRTAYGLARRLDSNFANELLKLSKDLSQSLEFSSDDSDDDMDCLGDDNSDIEEQEKLNETLKKINMSLPLVM